MIDIKADYMKLKACWLQDNMTRAKKLTKEKKIKMAPNISFDNKYM